MFLVRTCLGSGYVEMTKQSAAADNRDNEKYDYDKEQNTQMQDYNTHAQHASHAPTQVAQHTTWC